MRKLIITACCICLLSGCAATHGTIERRGTITIEGFEFSDCNKANADIEMKNGVIYLCGYSLTDLSGIHFNTLTFNVNPKEGTATEASK